MGAHPVDGRSYYQSEVPALGLEDESVAANGKLAKSELPIRVKFQKAGEQNEVAAREAASSDWSLRRAPHGDMRARHVSNGKLADDRDKHTESHNVAVDTVVKDPGSSKNKNGGDNVAEGPPCAQCGKTFSSLKALYGHLRTHSQKGRKGAHRPPEAKKKKLQIGAGSSSDKVLTPKRGHQGIPDSKDPEANAAGILLQLSRSNDLRPTSSPRREADRLQYRKSLRKEIYEEDIGGKGLQLMDAMHFENAEGIEGKVEKKKKKKKKKKKEKKIKDLESVHESSPPNQGKGYHCSTCSKSFDTHQALGGHIASHNKNKNNSEEVDETEDTNLAHAEELVDSNNLVPRATAKEHRCKICPAKFPTGQALGGHKRKHWKDPATTTAPSPPAPSPAPSSENVMKANNVLLRIDLNELPMLEAEEP